MNETERKQLNEEKARQKAKRAEGAKIIDPIVRVKFQNLEDPPAVDKPSPPFEFTFQTPNYEILTFKESRQEGIPDTALRHNQIYDLPLSVVEHINSRTMPIKGQKVIPDPLTGAPKIINYIAGYRNRFSCIPEDMGSFIRAESGGDTGLHKEKKQIGCKKKQDEIDETNKELENLGTE